MQMGKASHLNSGQRRDPMNGKQKIKDIALQQNEKLTMPFTEDIKIPSSHVFPGDARESN